MARVGAGKARVRLDDVLPFDGFDEVRDDIFARALVVEADQRVCIVSLEVTSLRSDLLAELRSTAAVASGCPEEQVWMCVTHTFSAPHVRTVSHIPPEDVARNTRLAEAYVSAVREAASVAAASAVEAALHVASGRTDVNVNRDVETPGGWWLGRDPRGFSDHGIRALVARRAGDETPLAVLFSADVQSSVLDRSKTSEGHRVVSGDLAGRAASFLEQRLPGCVALFVVGCAADQAPVEQAVTQEVTATGQVVRHDLHEAAYEYVEGLGVRLGEQVLSSLVDAHDLACDHVASSTHQLTCPGQGRADFAGLRPMRTYEYVPAGPVDTTVSVLELGELVLVGVEPELSSALGHRMRTGAQGPMDVLTMVNGAQKYLPDAAAYDKITYEAMNSSFGRGSDEVLATDVLASVAGIRKGRQS